jgi:hypothetical protein
VVNAGHRVASAGASSPGSSARDAPPQCGPTSGRIDQRPMANRPLFALVLAAALGAACCPDAQAQGNPHDEAARLVGALELSGAQRNAARDFVVLEMARGGTPRAALQRWVQMQEARGLRVRCRPAAAADCIGR